MQRQFTLEIRVDYADNGKNEAMRVMMAALARTGYATAVMLADGVKPQVAIFSDDFFQGHQDIMLLDDTIAEGTKAISEPGEVPEQLSSELLNSVKGI